VARKRWKQKNKYPRYFLFLVSDMLLVPPMAKPKQNAECSAQAVQGRPVFPIIQGRERCHVEAERQVLSKEITQHSSEGFAIISH
jgi:hypothetical protein